MAVRKGTNTRHQEELGDKEVELGQMYCHRSQQHMDQENSGIASMEQNTESRTAQT